MKLFSSLTKGIKSHLDKKKEEREFEDKLRKEARLTERQLYEQEFRKQAKEAALIRAREKAYKSTGLAKLRAVSQSTSAGRPNTGFFSKLSEYTQANMKRKEEALARTEALRKAAAEERQRMMAERQAARANPGMRRSLY